MINVLKSNRELWELYTKKEEYDPPILDKFQRYRYYSSKHRNILQPKVSELLIKNGFNLNYPDNKKFGVCLTHDIDEVYFSIFRIGFFWSRGRIKSSQSVKMMLNKISKRSNPMWNFSQILELERKYGAKSSFYILALEKGNQDFSYRVEVFRNELKNIIDKGWEVGLHGGHEAYNNFSEIKKEKEKLEQVIGKEVVGYRNHYLKIKIPDTWELLKKAGFKYDTTLGYVDSVGFRNGMCHPFRPFNLNTNRFIDIMEIPLNIMDCSLDEYMGLDFEGAWKITTQLIDTVEENRGVVTLVWHNTYMINEWLDFYEKILKYCYEKNAWMSSGENIYNHIKTTQYM